MNNRMIDIIMHNFPEEHFVIATGFDDAIIGMDEGSMRIIYSIQKCIQILIEQDNMSEDDALEHFDYNVSGSYIGDKTPIWSFP